MSRFKNKSVIRYSLLIFILIIAGLVFADDEKENQKKEDEEKGSDFYVVVEEEKLDDDVSLTATKIPVQTQLVPASIGVVDDTLIESQQATFLSDALRNVSGINVQNGFGVFDFFTVRGLDSLANGLILTDGAPEPEVMPYELYNVERVEVLKGPGAFLYGGNPLSGTVQLVRKHPLLTENLKLQSSFGSFDSFQGALDWNAANKQKNIAFRLNGTARDSSNYRDDKDNHSFAVNPALTWLLNPQSNLTFNFEVVDNEFKPDSGIPVLGQEIADVPRTRSYQAPFDISDQRAYRFRVDYVGPLNDTFTLHNKFYYTDLDWLSNGTLIVGAFPVGLGGISGRRVQPRLDDHQKLIGNQTELKSEFNTGDVRHKLLTGFEVSRLGDEFVLDLGALPPIDLFNPVETATDPPSLIASRSQSGDARSIVVAPYAVDQVLLSDKLNLFLGARFDVLDFNDDLEGTSRNEHQLSPLLGFVFSPRTDLSIYASAARAFAPPSSLVIGEREPEKSTQFEAGIKKYYKHDSIKTFLAFYSLEKDNIAIPDATGITKQTGNQTSRGIEFACNGDIVPGWNATLSYAFNDSELTSFSELVFTGPGSFIVLDRSGNKPAFAPAHIFNLWVLREFQQRFRVGGGPRYVSSQFISEDNAFKIDGYVTFDAHFAYRMQNWWFSVNFKNLTDREYEARGSGNASVIPANPFAVYFGVNFEKQVQQIWKSMDRRL